MAKPPKNDPRYGPTKAELEEDVRIHATFDGLADGRLANTFAILLRPAKDAVYTVAVSAERLYQALVVDPRLVDAEHEADARRRRALPNALGAAS